MDWLGKRGLKAPETTTAPHAGVVAADPYSFRVAHRRLAWMLRLSAGTNIVLGAALVMSINAISIMLPLKTTEIALVRSDPEDKRLYRIEPLTTTVEGFDLYLEDKAQRFVPLLLSIDAVTQTERLREAFRMMDRKFYDRFQKERIESGEIQKAIDSGIVRTVSVESINRLTSYRGSFKLALDFIQTDTRSGEVVDRVKVRAYIDMTTRPHDDVPERDKYENPLGFVVLDMILKTRESS